MTTYPPQPDYAPQPQSNGLGLAGFIVSLSGTLLTCGVVAPVGLILSLVALRKEPRGFAIAGAVIGAIGTLIPILYVVFVGSIMLPALHVARERALEMRAEGSIVSSYYESNNQLPLSQDEAELVLSHAGLDFEGNWPRYTKIDEDSFELRWPGGDERFDTIDDRIRRWDAPASGASPQTPNPTP